MAHLITLTTDFGLTDGFVGVMKGVILSIHPDAQIVDITHDIAPQNIQQGAFLLENSVPYFPAASIHVCVVDPGVGSSRRPIALQIGETIFVGPDNGVLSLAVENMQSSRAVKARAFHLNNPRYWLPKISNTFHGRDIFAPSAAHLARGVRLEELGEAIDEWIRLSFPKPLRGVKGRLVGRVVYIDRYGNIVSNVGEADLRSLGSRDLCVEIGGHEIRGLARTYSDVARGELAALIGSPWRLEVAQREGNAAQTLGVKIGDEIIVRVT